MYIEEVFYHFIFNKISHDNNTKLNKNSFLIL